MNPLHRIRQLASSHWGRAILAWVLLSLGAATAAPLINPQSMEIVCSSVGEISVVVRAEDGSQHAMGTSHWDCALCLPFTAPPAHPVVAVAPPIFPTAHALEFIQAAHIAAITAAPLPARGPPSLLS